MRRVRRGQRRSKESMEIEREVKRGIQEKRDKRLAEGREEEKKREKFGMKEKREREDGGRG